jgi:photosystem II stability/assembly factor-like uncharacterized protein
MFMKITYSFLLSLLCLSNVFSQKTVNKPITSTPSPTNRDASTVQTDLNVYFKPMKWRNIGPFRGGRAVTVSGVINNPLEYYAGTTGGGLWKTEDAGLTWQNTSDGFFKTGSVGAVAVAESDANVIYVGMGEHPPRGVMTSYGDGVYKSTDAGKTWKKLGLDATKHIAGISIDPKNPDIVYIAAQGAIHGATEDRGIYKSTDGGTTWKKIFYVDENTGCVDLSMDMNNPRILYAAMWDYRRTPWEVRSGGKGCGLWKSTDGGETWTRLENGLPKELGKMGISVSRVNPEHIYAVIESDSKAEKGGCFASTDGGKTWTRVSKDHRLVQRAWYYTEIIADPQNENTVYILNTSILKSIDGGKTWATLSGTHGDHHGLWINPKNNKNIANANDGGGAVTFNSGATWSLQSNQPTAQFYRVNVDNRFPYRVYGGQQDNTSVMIMSRNPSSGGISDKDWTFSAGGESAFAAFDPNNPRYVMGGSYQGTVEILDTETNEGKGVMVVPVQYLAKQPKDMTYRFNWNAPMIYGQHEANIYFHAGNRVFKTADMGKSWQIISPDLTRHDTAKMGFSGVPYTNEGAGGENYGTIAYLAESPHEKGVMWSGSDDGLVHLTRDGGKTWTNVTPPGLDECLINSIELSPFDKGTAFIATTRYKFNDFTPSLFKTTDYGKTWTKLNKGLPNGAFTRVVRQDIERKDLLFCGTELGLYVSFNGGELWQPFQRNLPICPVLDLKIHKGDLIAATSGRAFWILDDLGLVRQYAHTEGFTFYKPEDAYRTSSSSPLDKNGEDDNTIRMSRSGFAGTNPASGVVLYYQLPEKKDSNAVLSLDILNEKGQIIRSYSSQTDPKFVSFVGGPSAEPTLSTKVGLNRFVWDMRYATLPAVTNVVIEGSYEGRKVVPGNYQARLKMGDMEKTVSFSILPDPRLDYPLTDYVAQEQTLQEIEKSIKDIHNSVNQTRQIKKQISDFMDILKDKPEMKTVNETGKKVVERIDAWESELIQPKSQSNDDVINFENKLNAEYFFIKGELDVNTPYVTEGQKQRLSELNTVWQKRQMELTAIQKSIDDFNNLCRQMNMGRIVMPIVPSDK